MSETRNADNAPTMCACGHTVGSHMAEPYCVACAGDPCDLDFRAWLAERERAAAERAWDEGRKATWSALGAPFIWFAPENPYRIPPAQPDEDGAR